MIDHSPGRLRWFDTMILAVTFTAALAVAYSDDRWLSRERPIIAAEPPFPSPPWKHFPRWVRILWQPSNRISSDLLGFLTVVTVGLPFVTLRPGRIEGSGGWPAPGVAATAGAAIVLVLEALIIGHAHWSAPPVVFPPGVPNPGQPFYFSLSGVETSVPGAILGAWVVLALLRRWKARPDWPDRLGRLVGWVWIGHMVWTHVVWSILWG